MIGDTQKVLKTDTLGRVKTPRDRRETLLDEFERSGLSGAKFAALAGIKYQTFASWVAHRRKTSGVSKPPSKPIDQVRWLEAVVAEAQRPTIEAPCSVKVHLPGSAWMEIKEAKQVELAVAIVRALEKPLSPC
jgi:restriction endonuclease Mrr